MMRRMGGGAMLERREVLTGAGCIAALGAAEWLRPRHAVSVMPNGASLKTLIPRNLPGFDEGGTEDIVIPKTEGSLSSRLYSDQLARSYQQAHADTSPVMMLLAYGPAQTDMLQVHRPEICYPAIGFEIAEKHFLEIPNGRGQAIPAVALTAVASDRIEDVIYWTRVGQSLPRNFAEQSWDRWRQSLAGNVNDGTLVRASAIRVDNQPQFAQVSRFMEALIAGVPKAARPVLIGGRA